MPYSSQMDVMRALIEDELVHRVVLQKTPLGSTAYWECDLCHAKMTFEMDMFILNRFKHTTFCKLREALGVVE